MLLRTGVRFAMGDSLSSWHQTHLVGEPAIPVHQRNLRIALKSLFVCFLAWLYRRKKFDGQVFATYLVSYAILRSFVELFRGDYPDYQHFLAAGRPRPNSSASAFLSPG